MAGLTEGELTRREWASGYQGGDKGLWPSWKKGNELLARALAVDETVQLEECFYWSSRKRIRVTRIHISRGCASGSGWRSVSKTPAEPNIYFLVSWMAAHRCHRG